VQKPESQDICFAEGGNYAAVLEAGMESISGPIVDIHGKQIGQHEGIHKYTIIQRKGLGALGKKMFVKELWPLDNTVVAGTEDDL
jgi:tRNA-uridine 2-sulfurtransferase